MRTDAKIFNKYTGKPNPTKRIIHHDQVRFIPGMQVWFNIQKINVIRHINKGEKKSHVITSTDVAKNI